MFIPSLDLTASQREGGVWESLQNKGCRVLKNLSEISERFWLGKWYFPVLLFVSTGFVALNKPVAGMMVLLALTAWFLALCEDLLACICPLVMVFVMSALSYGDFGAFWPLAVFAIPLGMALWLHLTRWPVIIRAGRSVYGLVMVSAATLLGGCDVLRSEEFWNLQSLYYTLGLGVVLLGIYLLFRSCLRARRNYSIYQRFAAIFCAVGLLMAAIVLADYVRQWQTFAESGSLLYLAYRNFAATILLTTMPLSFYRALHSRRYLLSGAVMLAAMVLTGSRSALLFGAVEVVLGCVYLVRCGVVKRRTMWIIVAIAAVLMVAVGLPLLTELYAARLHDGQLIRKGELRWKLWARGIDDFLHHPVFGMGLGSTANSALDKGVAGSMFFYHNMVLQVLASMGIFGVAAYGRLISDRISLLLTKKTPFTAALAISYLGMLMVSMTNPGEFCPFPNAGLMVMVFSMAEEAVGDVALPVTQLLGLKQLTHSHKAAPAVHMMAHK